MHNLIMRGIPTLVPVAFGERKRWGILRDCFFVFKKTLEATSGAIFLKKLFEAPLSTPAKAGIQNQSKLLDSRLCGSDKLGMIRSAQKTFFFTFLHGLGRELYGILLTMQ